MRPDRAREVLAPVCAALLAHGCVGGGSARQPGLPDPTGPDPAGRLAPATPNPVGLEFRPTDIGDPAAPDGSNHRTPEYMGHWGLDGISADEAYQRGYFGQGVTIAVADDGLDATHPDLEGKIVAPRHVVDGSAEVFEPSYGGAAWEGHGTYVALVAAGASGNDGEAFEIDIAGGNPIPTANAHGVAPRASVMPIQLAGGGQPAQAVRHAVANDAQVLNFSIGISESYYGEYTGRDGVWLTTPLPLFGPLLTRDLGDRTSSLPGEFREVAEILQDRDIVAVWASGNEAWNAVTGQTRMCGKNFIDEDGCPLGEGPVTATEFMQNFSWLYDKSDPDRKIAFRDIWGECGREDCADYNSGSGWAVAPLFEPGLLGKWLVVGALDRNGEIAGFSNGCGEARNWCLLAPGVDLQIGLGTGGSLSGTSFAAPMVSGALAVLKSRLPSMPMEVVQALLLVSADPLGTRLSNPDEPDPVYGWGALNLGNAIAMQGTVRLPRSVPEAPGTAQGVTLADARIALSPVLAHVGERLRAVEAAVIGVGNAYYNMSLFDTVAMETDRRPALGHAAIDMLTAADGEPLRAFPGAPHGVFAEIGWDARGLQAVGMDFSAGMLGRWRLRYGACAGCDESPWRKSGWTGSGHSAAAPFFALTGAATLQMHGYGIRPFAAVSGGRESARAPWRQFGLRWLRRMGGIVSMAEASRVEESGSVWGANFGTLGGARTRTMQYGLALSVPLGRTWRGLLDYERSSADVSTTGRLSHVSGLRAEGWSAGIQGRHVFRSGDLAGFSIRRDARVSGGRARIDHIVAAGSGFVDAFYLGRPQFLKRKQTVIDLRGPPVSRYALGYGLPLGGHSVIAFGLEYEGESGDYGISTHLLLRNSP